MGAKKPPDVELDDPGPAPDERAPDDLERRGRAPLRPVAIRRVEEVRLEDGFQHELRRLLRHTVADRRDAQWPDAAVRMPRGPPGSPDRPRPPRDSSAPASTPPPARQAGGFGHRGHGSAAPAAAWPPRIADVGVVAPCPRAPRPGGGWAGWSRPCPGASLRPRRGQSRGPPRASPVLRPRRTPAALRPTSPSAYTDVLYC